MTEEKRVSVNLKNPNPLFEKWLIEWRDEALERNSKLYNVFNFALKSLKQYPLPLESGKDCMILKGFGKKLCVMLDKKLQEYKSKGNSNTVSSVTSKRKHEYIPVYRSGAYAILLTLYRKSEEPNFRGYLTKAEIIEFGQMLCDKSFTRPDPGTFYTSWSSMKTLLEKGLVLKYSSPAKFSLTDEGKALGRKLIKHYENEENQLGHHNNASRSQAVSVNPGPSKAGSSFDQTESLASELYQTTNSTENLWNKQTSVQVSPQPDVSNKSRKGKTKRKANEKEYTSSQDDEESVSSSSQIETHIFPSNSFDIILLVDCQETSGAANHSMDPILNELSRLAVVYEVRHLKVGDYTWICRDRNTNKELVLPYIIERKRMDDLGSSIKDGRFHEQKFRLKQSGIQNVIYLIESYGINAHCGLPITSLYQAAANTLIQDNFHVKFTESLKGTAEYLASLTKILIRIFQCKTVMSCPKENLSRIDLNDDLIPLMLFQEFNKGASKSRNFTVKEMFARHLLQIKGMSIEKALAVVERYPTPKLLKLAYEECSPSAGEKLLSTVPFGKLKKNIGPVLSKTVYLLYNSNQFP